ncbi:unnamed protein product [Mytilus edulis]|uniref:WSC domain-containing protein n=1 Tax=Mytilus edulis TaxID=6550 RepID=A0A8S3QN34_MYTED|nr:unnamed protein product [Mytilus edulis]
MFGCYWNDQSDTLSVMQQTTSSTLQCINLCLGENTNYIYAGTEKNPNRCYCGHKLRVQVRADVAECKAPCPVLVTDLCGRDARLAVYNISGLIFPVTLSESVITTESTTKFTNTHRQLTFSTSEVLIDETTTGSIRSTFTKSTYSLVPSSSLTLDETTYLKTSYSAKEGLTVYNSTHTS